MERKKEMLKTGYSRILWAVMTILLCATPCAALTGIQTVLSGDTLDLGTDYVPDNVGVDNGWVDVYGTLNMYPGAYVDWGIYAHSGAETDAMGGIVNVYGCAPGNTLNVLEPTQDRPLPPVATVYGPKFKIGTTGYPPGDHDVPINGLLEVLSESDELLFSLTIHSGVIDIQLRTPSTTITVDIDIKPGSDTNPINQGSNGVIPVAILTTDSFDASTVDPGTVTLAGAEVAVRGKSEKLMARLEDVDGDGDDDLMLQVDTQSEGAVWEAGPVTLLGTTYEGQAIEGTDNVTIVPPE